MQLQLQFVIHFLPVSSGFHIYTHAFRSLLRVVYALPTVQDKCRLQHHGLLAQMSDDSWRKCRLLHHGYNAAAMTLGPAAILCPGFRTSSWQKRSKRSKGVKYCGCIHTLRSPPNQGGDVCKVWLRSVQKCGFVQGTNKQTNKTNKKPFQLHI
jgi:hypothetical protein